MKYLLPVDTFEYGCYKCGRFRLEIKKTHRYIYSYYYSEISTGSWEQEGTKLILTEESGLNQFNIEIINGNRLLEIGLPGIHGATLFQKCDRKKCKDFFLLDLGWFYLSWGFFDRSPNIKPKISKKTTILVLPMEIER
jgi:hypothetical protein